MNSCSTKQRSILSNASTIDVVFATAPGSCAYHVGFSPWIWLSKCSQVHSEVFQYYINLCMFIAPVNLYVWLCYNNSEYGSWCFPVDTQYTTIKRYACYNMHHNSHLDRPSTPQYSLPLPVTVYGLLWPRLRHARMLHAPTLHCSSRSQGSTLSLLISDSAY